MYHEHFGLDDHPFRNTPDTRVFFPGGKRGVILEAMEYAILQGEGIIKVVGEVGSGKTMLCHMLGARLGDRVETVFIANPSLTPDNIFHAIAVELRLALPAGADKFLVVQALQDFLLEKHRKGKSVVVLLEEAQCMPLATLEEIRLLSNLETKQSKLLQLVLFGQPELDENLAVAAIRQLKERISYQFNLLPFSHDEVREYLLMRLRAAGYRGPHPFHVRASRHIWKISNGLCRRINLLADKSLLSAFIEKQDLVKIKHVKQAAAESSFTQVHNWRTITHYLIVLLVMTLPLAGWLGYHLANRFHPSVSTYSNPVLPDKIPTVSPKLPQTTGRSIPTKPTREVQIAATTPPAAALTTPTNRLEAPVPIATPKLLPYEKQAFSRQNLDDFLQIRLKTTEAWLQTANRDDYTIQLMLMSASVGDWLEDIVIAEKSLDGIFHIKPTLFRNRQHYSVYFGHFPSYGEAKQAIDRLPERFRLHTPFVQSLRRIVENR